MVPDRRLRIEDFALEDAAWAALRIPVEMAFFFHTHAGRARAAPSTRARRGARSRCSSSTPGGAGGGQPRAERLEPDVEALLVNRARGAREHWIVPIDDCYALVGLMRTRWRGLSGGAEVWAEIERSSRTSAGGRGRRPNDGDEGEARWRS